MAVVAKVLISPSLESRVAESNKILASAGLALNHPDLLYLPYDSKLGVEQAKEIRGHLSFKPFQSSGRGVVLEDASNLTPEAQNALLKTLEELPENALFIMGASSEHNFLPTVLSRCEIIRLDLPNNPLSTSDVEHFEKEIERLLKSDIPERFEYIEKLKDKEEFLQALVQYFHQKLPTHQDFAAELLQAENWTAHNVNLRAILEYLMLIMPRE